jgi:hypothetical protein
VRGGRGKAPIPEAEHPAKIRDCLSVRLTHVVAERCIALAGSLDTQSAGGVAELPRLLGGA